MALSTEVRLETTPQHVAALDALLAGKRELLGSATAHAVDVEDRHPPTDAPAYRFKVGGTEIGFIRRSDQVGCERVSRAIGHIGTSLKLQVLDLRFRYLAGGPKPPGDRLLVLVYP